jgi:PIN domain nuclease of toxin-antitoxin system
MNAAVVIDASALLALLNVEPGADVVAAALGASAMSAVNWSEVVQKVAERGLPTSDLAQEMQALGLEIVPFDVEAAEAAADLWSTGARSISLADRACLATGRVAGLPVLTTDRAWTTLDLGVEIRPIR